ncbi:catechol 1,2-dioxygenase [Aeromicrobium alkaliterrae]|uniref:Catechol 1,2-dioxygenase n=1 Tax=Aeromicrobium alkaliterrae TaxID=302168 RepID=A0ABP4WGQ6_9ACTN
MQDNRVVQVVEDLEQTLLQFIRKHRISHADYRLATDLIVESVKQGEESLLFDIFFEAEATDVGSAGSQASQAAIEGPFYIPGAPLLEKPYVMPQREDEAGEPMTFSGVVSDLHGNAVSGAVIDVWHADAAGLYSQIHPNIPEWNLRARFVTEADGSFTVETILPPPYEIPKDGPTGIVLNALGRHFFRPAHVHLKVSADGFEDLTSQLYFPGGEFLDNDVANAVRDGLMFDIEEDEDGVHAKYDFTLTTASPSS